MPEITIVTVNWFSGNYILSLLAHLHVKAHQPKDLCALVIDNTNGRDASLQKLKDSPIPNTILNLDSRGLKGSQGHAFALDYAMDKLETEYSVVLDPDIHVFWQGWDQFCIAEMQRQNAVAVGAPYPVWKVGKYHDFPSPPFCFFHTDRLRQLENDWSPYGATALHNAWTFFIRQIGRLGSLLTRKRYEKYPFLRKYAAFAEKRFGVFSQDTGWKLAEEALQKGLRTIVFDTVLPDDPIAALEKLIPVFRSMARAYELFAYDHHIFLAHKYGTGGWPWRTERGDDEAYWQSCIQQIEDGLH